MKRYLLALTVAVLAACGGYVATADAPDPAPAAAVAASAPAVVPPEPAQTPAPPPVQTPVQTPVPAASAPPPVVAAPVPPVIDLPEPGPTWADLWREDWAAPRIGGTVRHTALNCGGQLADPNQLAGRANIAAGGWAGFGGPRGATFAGGALVVDDLQSAGGWALLGEATFDPAQPLRLSGVVDLTPDRGAWLGLTLIQDESDYRELALYEAGGELRAGVWAPCFIEHLGPVAPGPRALSLEYHPVNGWTFSVDSQVVHREPLHHLGAALVGRPRVGVYVVNLAAESRQQTTGRVRARVGPLRVQVLKGG